MSRLRDEHTADLRQRVQEQAGEIARLHTVLAQAHQRLRTAVPDGEWPGSRQGQQSAAPAEWPEGRRWWQRLLWG